MGKVSITMKLYPMFTVTLVMVLLPLPSLALETRKAREEVSSSGSLERRKDVRWFPADLKEDCVQEPGVEQVREGKPSQACRKDEERFCFCGRIVRGDGEPVWRFLCGTCTISFKLDKPIMNSTNVGIMTTREKVSASKVASRPIPSRRNLREAGD